MATCTFVELDLPEAANLADLTGVQFDLRTAKNFALTLQAILSADRPDYSLIDPLSTAIVVRYNRAFATGVRRPLREEALQQLTDNQRKKHEHLKALRDKHIAHSVNCFEESVPIARYWVERVEAESIAEISCNHYMVVGLSPGELSAVIELTDALLKFVATKIKEDTARLLSIVRAMPLKDVLSRNKGPTVPGQGPVDRRRKG